MTGSSLRSQPKPLFIPRTFDAPKPQHGFRIVIYTLQFTPLHSIFNVRMK
jgi:hypothetical protein